MAREHRKKTGISERQLRRKTCLNKNTPFSVREAYKITRTNLMFSTPEEGCKVIAVTSAFPGEGKTTTCTNMALSFGEMGKRVLLIDCDLRKAQIHNIFGLDNQLGASNVLAGFAQVTEAIRILHDHQIHVITSGNVPPNPAELLASEKMHRVLEELKTAYDYIFIDTPPVNLVTDAVALSHSISGMVLVTRQGKSTHRDISQALDKLNFAKVKVLGMIMTGEKHKGGSYGKYGKYGKYGSYKEYTAYE